ncbi:uncharacterized protein LOC132484675 [Mesoplodon densirostris]|uniref:uncharacterized protein LOC132484675 n=1 Tax=Mesoplodon densirostris TaxID=48708 RepID=UPI0028DC7E79|nr:uncharacterized protein LOC132484675 [Mesoplodon densirostris]
MTSPFPFLPPRPPAAAATRGRPAEPPWAPPPPRARCPLARPFPGPLRPGLPATPLPCGSCLGTGGPCGPGTDGMNPSPSQKADTGSGAEEKGSRQGCGDIVGGRSRWHGPGRGLGPRSAPPAPRKVRSPNSPPSDTGRHTRRSGQEAGRWAAPSPEPHTDMFTNSCAEHFVGGHRAPLPAVLPVLGTVQGLRNSPLQRVGLPAATPAPPPVPQPPQAWHWPLPSTFSRPVHLQASAAQRALISGHTATRGPTLSSWNVANRSRTLCAKAQPEEKNLLEALRGPGSRQHPPCPAGQPLSSRGEERLLFGGTGHPGAPSSGRLPQRTLWSRRFGAVFTNRGAGQAPRPGDARGTLATLTSRRTADPGQLGSLGMGPLSATKSGSPPARQQHRRPGFKSLLRAHCHAADDRGWTARLISDAGLAPGSEPRVGQTWGKQLREPILAAPPPRR